MSQKITFNQKQLKLNSIMTWASKVRKPKVEEGEIVGDEYDEHTRSVWQKNMILLSKGARWGDLECYAYEEIVIKERAVEKVIVKPFNCDNCAEACEVVIKKRSFGMVCLVCFDSIKAPVKLAKCRGCSFHVHSTPPADFTPEQRLYCCSICQTSRGHKHGGRCEQALP
jgi:hypothetical protein